MAFYEDLTPYTYLHPEEEPAGTVNIGWLDRRHPFPIGETTAEFFPWPWVQSAINAIESVVYRHAIKMAQELHLGRARPCPECGRAPADLFWLSVSDPEQAWDRGTGRVGFLTLCDRCHLQVDFFVDTELTELQAEEWRAGRFYHG